MRCKSLIVAIMSLVAMGASAQVNPIPTINGPVSPQAVVPGSAGFTLTVHGAGFVSGAVVNWNGAVRSTTFISAGELQAQILASDVAAPGSALVTVTNPLPGGGLSSSSYGLIEIHLPVSTMILGKPHIYGVDGSGVYTADFNGDNKLDILQSYYGFEILLGNGDGTFTMSASHANHNHGVDPAGFSFGDFNGDGIKDFAYAQDGGTQAFVCLGKGSGKFQNPQGFGNFTNPVRTATGDFNRDGKLDLVVSASDGLYLLLGNGDGTFQPQQMVVSISAAYALTSADFNGDGILDLGFFDSGTSLAAVLFGNGDGTFQPVEETQPGGNLDMLTSDFNGDGKLDFAILGSGNPWPLGMLLGNGDGTFQNAQFFSTGFTGVAPFFTAGDFNSDGNTDLLSYSGSGFLAGFLAGKGDGTFQRVARITLPGPTSKGLAVVGDFNSDGLLDFVINAGGGSEVFLQAPQ